MAKEVKRAWMNHRTGLFWHPKSEEAVHIPRCEVYAVDAERECAIIIGDLPQAHKLFEMANGDILEIADISCSIPPHQPENTTIIVRLSNCRVVSRILPNLTASSPRKAGLIRLWIFIKCDVEVLANEGD